MRFSRLGERLTGHSGTLQLMEDLGAAMATDEPLIMLGGGNPARIDAMSEVFAKRMAQMAADSATFERVMGVYDGQCGDPEFLSSVARLLNREFHWPVTEKNIAVTNGSQNAFFYLFNLFAGTGVSGEMQRVFLPLAPEYIGYGDQALEPGMFISRKPRIEMLDNREFKYRLDPVEAVPVNSAAICVSRPTNPTGNVLTQDELAQLRALADGNDIPLIIDNAYGTPFPDIIFRDANPVYDERTVVCLSLSKLGLPGVRTGIVVANEEIIRALGALNAVFALASSSFGPALVRPLFDNGEIVRLSREVIKPYYHGAAQRALAWLDESLGDSPARIHSPEGAFFMWLWCPDLPITSAELYRRLRKRNVLVVPGQYFFPGLQDEWRHTDECIRINYSQEPNMVKEGLAIIGEEVRRAYACQE